MRIQVRLFAAAAEAAGQREWSEEMPAGATAGDLLAALAERFPGLRGLLPRCAVAVDREYQGRDCRLHDGAEVAIIPPVSGGSTGEPAWEPLCRIVGEPIDPAPLMAHVSHEGAGGIAVFAGTVRGVTSQEGEAYRTAALEYEAYAEMAEAKMREIAAEAAARWPGVRLAMVHRVGRLLPGETSVLVAASAPHRDDAFSACRFAIDRIKTVVPIWKKEVLEDGRTFWVNHA